MSNESAEEIDNRTAPHLEYLSDRVNLLFAYHFCALEFKDDEDLDDDLCINHRTWALKTILTACLHTSLVALRDLDDFFSPTKTRADDLRVCDFGMTHSLTFLTKEERSRINKLIAHTTQEGATNTHYRWNILELVSRAVSQCDVFLEWVKTHFAIDHFNTWTAAISAQAKTRSILRAIQEEAGHRQDNTK